MAKAPKPGSVQRAQDAQTGIRIIIREQHYDLYLESVSLAIRQRVRQETGSSVEQLVAAFGLDTLAALVWIYRMQHGEASLSLEAVWDEVRFLNADEFDMEELSPGSHPEDESDPSS